MIWLAILLLVPFDLKTIDSSGNMITNILTIWMNAIQATNKAKYGAAILIGKLLTRKDIAKTDIL